MENSNKTTPKTAMLSNEQKTIAKGSYANSWPGLLDEYFLSKEIISYANFNKLVLLFIAFLIFFDFRKGFFFEKGQAMKCVIQYLYIIICLNIIWFFILTLLYVADIIKNFLKNHLKNIFKS